MSANEGINLLSRDKNNNNNVKDFYITTVMELYHRSNPLNISNTLLTHHLGHIFIYTINYDLVYIGLGYIQII